MSRTRKWSMVAQEATRLARLGASPLEIAEKIGINKSTVTRWIKAGKLTRADTSSPSSPVLPRQSPAAWARSMRTEYSLDSTDEQLVTLGEQALLLTRDKTVTAQVQLNAARTFQSIAKQLAITTRAAVLAQEPVVEAPSKKNPPVKRKSTGDPRTLYMVPKAVGQ